MRLELVEQPSRKRVVVPPGGLAARDVVATDPNGSAIHGVNALLGQFPFASLGIGALKQKLQQSGINYDGDVKPLFGNPIVISLSSIGVPSTSTLTHPASSDALIVWQTKDGDKLKSLLKQVAPGLHQTGEPRRRDDLRRRDQRYVRHRWLDAGLRRLRGQRQRRP